MDPCNWEFVKKAPADIRSLYHHIYAMIVLMSGGLIVGLLVLIDKWMFPSSDWFHEGAETVDHVYLAAVMCFYLVYGIGHMIWSVFKPWLDEG